MKKTGLITAMVALINRKADGIFELSFNSDKLDVGNFRPGEFIGVCSPDTTSVMPRPFSIFSVDPANNLFSILFKTVGKNTRLMSEMRKGQSVKIIAPLGNSYTPVQKEVWLVGGGIGIAPLNFFAEYYLESHKISLFYGLNNKGELVDLKIEPKLKQSNGHGYVITTLDNSFGHQGYITTLFEKKLETVETGKSVEIIACGPKPMLSKTAEVCLNKGIDCHVILEIVMACGLGSCLGCSIKTKSGQKRVCKEGPVFDAKEVILDD